MFWTPLMKSFFISAALTIISNTAQVAGHPRGLTLESNTQYSDFVYTGWYSVQTPVSLLINTTGTVVTYLPSCYHGSRQAYTIELFKNEGGNKMVIANDHVVGGFQRNTRLLWPSSALNASDSGTYRCSFQPPTTGADSRESYILHVVVPVKITEFNVPGTVFTDSEVDAVCCAKGYPEPVFTVTINGLEVPNSNKTYSDGGSRVCQHFELMAQNNGPINIVCRAKLGKYSCSHEPAAAYDLCRQARNETSSTKMITANERYCTPSVPTQIINGSLNCTNNTFGSMCQCSKNYFKFTDAVTTSCLGSGHWSSPIPECDDDDECARKPQPCKNGGTCINTVGNYHCTCAPDWKGRNCSIKKSSPSAAIIAGSTIGGLVMVALIGIGVYLCFYWKKPRKIGG